MYSLCHVDFIRAPNWEKLSGQPNGSQGSSNETGKVLEFKSGQPGGG